MSAFDTESETPELENLSSLAENIVYRLPGCADVMIRKTIQEVYRDFCRRSCCLRERRQFTLTYGDGTIPCPPRFGGVVDCVSMVEISRRKLHSEEYSFDGIKVMLPPYLVPAEGEEVHGSALVLEMPKINSEQVPTWFIQKYGDAIVSGVLSRLMAMTGKPWTDAQQAADERLRYENAVNETRVRYYAQNESGDLGCAVDYSGLI